MWRVERVAELERELAEQRQLIERAVARVRGIQAELDTLRRGNRANADLADLSRTDAILAVLQEAAESLTRADILKHFADAGRHDNAKLVTATLSYLHQQGRVTKSGRGRYLAT